MADIENKDIELSSSNDKNEAASNDNKKLNDNDPLIPDEILEAIPVEERGKVISVIKQSMISSVTRRNNPIADKITTEHIRNSLQNLTSKTKGTEKKEKGNEVII